MKGTATIKPNSNFHRMLTMLNLNGGTLYRAQMYQPSTTWDQATGKSIKAVDKHAYVYTGGMPKMTRQYALKPNIFSYERRGGVMGLVNVQEYGNRTWVTLLPKGRDILALLDKGYSWIPYI